MEREVSVPRSQGLVPVCIMNQMYPVRTLFRAALVTEFTSRKHNAISVIPYSELVKLIQDGFQLASGVLHVQNFETLNKQCSGGKVLYTSRLQSVLYLILCPCQFIYILFLYRREPFIRILTSQILRSRAY